MSGPIWPGFVDAMTALLLVLMFVLSIFMIVQSVLRETIDTQDTELDALAEQVAGLADALGVERNRAAALETEVGRLGANLTAAEAEGEAQAALIASLTGQLQARTAELDAASARITSFEAQVVALLASRDTALAERDSARGERDTALAERDAVTAERDTVTAERDAARTEASGLTARVADLEAAQSRLITEQEALNLALVRARDEVDAQAEAARLAAARREALEAMIAQLRADMAQGQASLSQALAQLAETEAGLGARQSELEAAKAEIAALKSDLIAAEALGRDADALRARTAELEASLTEAERERLAELARAEAQRARLTALETSLTEAERARLAELAAAEALRARLATMEVSLSDEEAARLAEAAAAAALRDRLANAETELTAMTLALEEQRKRAEETLTLLAAARAAAAENSKALTGREALLATAQAELSAEQARSAESARQVALLNEQISALRGRLGELQGLLDASAARDLAANVRLENLGSQLNSALAQVAAEQKKRAELEAAERRRLETETKKLENFRSEFFGQLRQLLAGRDGVRIVGDRFVFSSEVLFNPGSADLAPKGQFQIAGVVATLRDIAGQIPPDIDWIIRVDGHTDNVPLSGFGAFADNWELSQARALSVVRFMQEVLGFPPNRMAATGFGEWQPVAEGDSADARAQNRRIELKLTER
jgi:chemotaxis protein MotB